ncbi:hypothetical protein ACFKPU_22955, partial [Salmonella enterica subsp. enterica serovar Braenderup]
IHRPVRLDHRQPVAGCTPTETVGRTGAGQLVAVGIGPAALPHSVVYNKTPDQFIIDHLQELQPTSALLSNDLGAASALAWRLQR